jgi:hypothetical protein
MRKSNREKFIDEITFGDKWWYDRKIKIINTYLENPEKYGNENLEENWETLGQKILEEELYGSKWINQYDNRMSYLRTIVNTYGNKGFNKICDGYGIDMMMEYIKSKEKEGLGFYIPRPIKGFRWVEKSSTEWKEQTKTLTKKDFFDWSLLSETDMYGFYWVDYQKLENEMMEKIK